MRSTIEQGLVKVIGKIKPALGESQFLASGVLTPEEFVEAGDLLVYKCPGWKWEGGDPKKAVPYLPRDKQYLIARQCPCNVRAADVEKSASNTDYADAEVDGDEGWVCGVGEKGGALNEEPEDVPDATQNNNNNNNNNNNDNDDGNDDDDDDDDIPSMEGYSEEDNVDEGRAQQQQQQQQQHHNQVLEKASRTYDISITYDNYYAAPKMWLCGYGRDGATPLSATDIFEDISEDHARKTVTMDRHPHMSPERAFAFIHPCKHASVMKSMLDRMVANGREPRVDHYLFIFLKFMSAVIPTIEYDLSPEMAL